MKTWAMAIIMLFMASHVNADELHLPLAEEEDDTLSGTFGAYLQRDQPNHTGGNPELDEDEFVFEAILMLDKTLSDRDRLNVKVLGDIISAASQARLHNPQFRALQANASGNKRASADVTYSHAFDKINLGAHLGYSYEANRYNSLLYGFRLSMPFNQNNTTLGLRLDGFTDYFPQIHFTGQESGFTYRQTLSLNTSLVQVLSPFDLLSVGLDYTVQFGLLQTSYYSIFLNNVEYSEEAPGQRHRGAASGRWKHSLSEFNSFEAGYRFYLDDWRIFSHTIDVRYDQYVFAKHLLLEPSVRFYTQTAAYFYRRRFLALPTYRTSDSDLGDFTGAVLGLKASVIQLAFFPRFLDSITVGGNYWLRNDGLDIFWFELGFITHF